MVRRTHTTPPTDELFTRDLTWQPTWYLVAYSFGHNDTDHVEITEQEANAILDGWRARWPREDALAPSGASRARLGIRATAGDDCVHVQGHSGANDGYGSAVPALFEFELFQQGGLLWHVVTAGDGELAAPCWPGLWEQTYPQDDRNPIGGSASTTPMARSWPCGAL